jgi:acyl carrier protein
MSQVVAERMATIKEIVAEVLEIELEELTETSRFKEDHDADSLRAIEILARLEKSFHVTIDQSQLPKMTHVAAVYDVLKAAAGWAE